MEYVPGDPILIKNIVTQLKSQGIFDQFRKECIADVDTKPAYQNLCHLADTQVSKFLSKVKWGPDLHKNQIRENIRKHVNECNFVEPGIAIIVDQLVNPRINTVLVPKVEEMLYKYLGIPIPECVTNRREVKPFNDRHRNRDKSDGNVDSNTTHGYTDKRRDMEKYNTTNYHRSQENSKHDGQRNDGKFSNIKNDATINKVQFNDKNYRDSRPPGIKTESLDTNVGKGFGQMESEKLEPKIEIKEELIHSVAMDIESSDDEISPPYEPHEKSDVDMSLDSGDSNYSEIIDIKTTESTEPDIPGFEPPMEKIAHIDDSKTITGREDIVNPVHPAQPPAVPEKASISPLEIPKTPTINYETSDDSDDYVKNKNTVNTGLSIDAAAVQVDEIPDLNFDKIVEKVIEDNADEVAKQFVGVETKPHKEDDSKSKDKSTSEDAKKKHKHKDEKSKSTDAKEKHIGEKKHEHRSDKDKLKHDKHKSDHKSKDRDKEKSKHDSKSHKKDEKSAHSKDRDRSKSDHDRKSKKDDKNDTKKDDKKEDKSDPKKDHKSSHKKDDKSDRRRDDEKKHRDDKDRKNSSKSSDDKRSGKSKSDDPKHKQDDRKNKDSKKKEEDKKSRTHCNADEKKKTDRRSSDRDSSGPSASNSSFPASHSHSGKTDKDKGSSKHKHSSSSHKSKKNDGVAKPVDKGVPEDGKIIEDDLEMILESSPEKAYQRPLSSDSGFGKILPSSTTNAGTEKNDDNIEDMMNEMFQPSKPTESSQAKASLTDGTDVMLKKPKIAKNFADIRRIMKLRKLYKDSFKLKEEQGKENTDIGSPVEPLDLERRARLEKTVEYFVKRRFGKNGSNAEKCRELTNAIIDTLTEVKLNITRVDRRYSIVDGSCLLNDEKKQDENNFLSDTNQDFKNTTTTEDSKKLIQEVDNIPEILNDETTNLVLDDLAKSYVNHEFKLDNLSTSSEDEKITSVTPKPSEPPAQPEDKKKLKVSNSRTTETKANGAKKKLPNKLKQQILNLEDSSVTSEPAESNQDDSKSSDATEDTSPSLKLKFKSTFDGKNKTWHTLDQTEPIEDPVFYLPPPSPNEGFRKCAAELIENALNIDIENLVLEMEYPECYDNIFQSQLGATVTRRRVPKEAVSSPAKYNFEIITKNSDDKTITLRIKKSSEMSEPESNKKPKKRKIEDTAAAFETTDGDDFKNVSVGIENKKVPVKRKNEGVKRKTLGVKRSLLSTSTSSPNTLNLLNTSEHTDESDSSVKKIIKTVKGKKLQESTTPDVNHKRSESESSDGRRSSVSSTGNNTHVKGINDINTTPTAKNIKRKNSMANDCKTETPTELNTTNVATTTKVADPPKKVMDAKSLEEKRKQTIMNCYYDESDLYKPRPSYRLTSRRYRLGNTDNT